MCYCLLLRGVLAQQPACAQSSATALHYASRKGHSILVGDLLGAGADIAAVNSRGSTALHEAAIAGREGLISQLARAGQTSTQWTKMGTRLCTGL